MEVLLRKFSCENVGLTSMLGRGFTTWLYFGLYNYERYQIALLKTVLDRVMILSRIGIVDRIDFNTFNSISFYPENTRSC